MTRDEVKKIIAVIAATFPNFDSDDPTTTIDAWMFFLADYSYEEINMALKIFVNTANSAFAPSPSQLIAMRRKPQELSIPDEVSVWREIRKAISRGIYYHEEDFPKLSPIAQRLVGEAGQLREWALLPSEAIDDGIQRDVKFRYKAMVEKEMSLLSMPKEVREMIATNNNPLQIGVNDG